MTTIKQKKRTFSVEENKAIIEKVDKFSKAGFIRVDQYPECVANVAMVENANRAWRIFVHFVDLNKAYPKDSYPLP